jgi:hypothetical protein
MACDDNEYIPSLFYYDFESVENDTIYHKTDFYEDMCISFVVKSYMVFDYNDLYNSDFVEIVDSSKVLTCNRDIYITDDTIRKNTNLFNGTYESLIRTEITKLKSIQNDCYLIRINPLRLNLSQSNTGYYKFYFNAKTINNRIIRDSTVIKNSNTVTLPNFQLSIRN